MFDLSNVNLDFEGVLDDLRRPYITLHSGHNTTSSSITWTIISRLLSFCKVIGTTCSKKILSNSLVSSAALFVSKDH